MNPLRTYTVQELDALRAVVTKRVLYGTSNPNPAHVYACTDNAYPIVEACVQTHILAGHTAEDISRADDPTWHDPEVRVSDANDEPSVMKTCVYCGMKSCFG